MRITTSIDPVTRLEGHMSIELTVDTINGVQQVVDARSAGTLFRGFEKLLIGRDPRDAQQITERICGVCPVSHSMAAVLALDAAGRVNITSNARILRNLVMAANFIDSHILHFYTLAIPDFVEGPAMPPWQTAWVVDRRFSATQAQALVGNYVKALDMRRKAQEMGAIFGGKFPHPPTFLPGGITAVVRTERIEKMKAYLNELIPFIRDVYIKDVELLAAVYPDYFQVGRGYGNLLAFGCFDYDNAGSAKLLKRGRLVSGQTTVQTVNVSAITEQLKYGWYSDANTNLNPSAGQTNPVYPKTNAYSWLKAPRYSNGVYEVGALARMAVNGDYRNGVSVMDRHRARAYETLKIALAAQQWIGQMSTSQGVYTSYSRPSSATAIGLTEAPRGALGHWLQVSSSVVSRYQIITPTCWNCSPRDDAGKLGPLEKALIGVQIRDLSKPVEAMRVIHSFDPCLDCAVHVLRPEQAEAIAKVER